MCDVDQPIVIAGSGSLDRIVIDILNRNGDREIAGITDIKTGHNVGEYRNGVEIRWTADHLIKNRSMRRLSLPVAMAKCAKIWQESSKTPDATLQLSLARPQPGGVFS